MKRSLVFLSSFLNHKAKHYGEKAKKFSLWLVRNAEGLHTLQRTVAPNSCWLQYILKYVPFKQKFSPDYLQLALQSMRAAEPKHHWKSNYLSRLPASFDGSNNTPLGVWEALFKIPAPKWRRASIHLFASGDVPFCESTGTLLWEQVLQDHLKGLLRSLNPPTPLSLILRWDGQPRRWALCW